jgi:hypothetical protein
MSKSSKKGPAVAALYEALAEHAPGEAIPAEALRTAEEKDAASAASEAADEQAPSDTVAAATPATAAPPWRTVALCQRSQAVAFADGMYRYLGGEIEDQPSRVDALRPCDGWQFVELEGPEQLSDLRDSLEREVAELSKRAAAIGYDLVRNGSQIKR